MYEFHSDRDRYFQMQKMVCEENIIPFIEKVYSFNPGTKILEIGCGTTGVLSAFLEKGYKCFGVDMDNCSLDFARERLAGFVESKQLTLICNDIYSVDFNVEFHAKFDIVLLKDVIEHIYNQEKLFLKIHSLLAPSGVIFIGFPPWQMPFGGHQQICRNKILSHLPYFHLLPMPVYKSVLKIFNEGSDHLCELKKTGISIERFEKLAKETKYQIMKKDFYLINPIYKHKFKMKERKQSGFISSIPFFRNFFTTCAFYILQA